METKRKRKVLSDCTNTTPPSIKQPSLASAIKRLLTDTSGKAEIKSNSKAACSTTATNENTREIAAKKPTSAAIASSTPPKSSRLSGIGGESQVVEPCSVYSRRRTDKRKCKDKEVAQPLEGSRAVCFDTVGDKSKTFRDTALSKSFREHHKKKKKDDSQHMLTQDFIEKQRAYFAEIDAFELPEEEIETMDQLE